MALHDGAGPQGEVKSPLPAIAGASPADARGVPLSAPEPVPGCGVGFDTGHPEEDEPGGPLFGVEPTPDGWWLRFGRPGPDLSRVQRGHAVYLSADPRLAADAKAAVERGRRGVPGRIAVRLTVEGAEGEPLRARLTALGAAGRGVSVEGETAERLARASGDGLGVEVLSQKLGAFGGTPFRLAEVQLDGLGAGLHVPVSALKALRRALVTELEAKLLAAARHAVDPSPVTPRVIAEASALHARRPYAAPARPTLIPLVRTDAQLSAVIAAGLPEVELDWMELNGLAQAVARARAAGLAVTVATTRIQKPGEAGVDERLSRLAPDGVLVRHWSGLMHFSRASDAQRPLVHGDFSLNVTNSVTAHHLLALGCDTLTAAHDLDEAQLHALLARVPAERFTVVVHHHIPTFHTEHCVYAHTLSHGRDFRTCGRPCERHQVALRDREGREHPVVVDWACRNTVFNAQAQCAARAVPGLVKAGVRRFRVEFVREDERTTATVLAAWRALLANQLTAAELLRTLQAHEQFGVTAGTMRTVTSLER